MTSISSQVILHPAVSQSIKLGSTTLGRDKLYRAVQYFSRFLAWFLLSRGHKEQAAKWNALKSHLALGRKLMRIGKPVEHLQAVLRAVQAYSASETREQITTIGRQLAYFGYLTYDTIVWANAVKFITLKPDTAQKINKTSNRFWLAGILLSITHGLLKAGRLANEAKKLRSKSSEKDIGTEADRELKQRTLELARSGTRQQFIIDILDVWVPAANLGLVNLNDGILGIFGFITSVIALRQQWHVAGKK
ncbi:peroxisomal biogenesis factor 11 [Neolentinus lepideus HHB14362 ss-1]|uniref:Peroxisomal biogenesis factor 11 n=1 Tax=Neolentinus lepideus HHB14362 ss-1 TaxID=1314782 RepID=A0A165W1F5_9AGAM|nr:peroxisomal biogenesis factor 11 [Neolentinus lepideus HHB14362 ss-1]